MDPNHQALFASDGGPFLPACRWNLIQFGFICCYTMGLNAIWMFPYYVYRHTGLFLVAFYLLLILVAIPVTFIQLKLGAVYRRGLVSIFAHFLPALKGVACSVLLLSYIFSSLNSVYISYGVYYMWASLKHPYGWTHFKNATARAQASNIIFGLTPAEDYYYNDFLQKSSSLAVPGIVPWHLGLSLFGVWVITYFFIWRGPSWFGKVVYGSSPVALLALFALVIYSHVAIPTAYQSLGHFFNEHRQEAASNGHATNGHTTNNGDILKTQLSSPLTWIRALEQHVFSVGLWAGILPSLGNRLGNRKPASNLTWLIVLLVHSMLPHIGTIAMAPFLHALAVTSKLPFEKVISSGPALLFSTLPEAFAKLHVSPFWAFLTYACFVLFALHQQALLLLVIMDNAVESFPHYVRVVFRRREFMAAALCTFAFFMALPQASQGGSYLSQLVDVYLYRALFVLILLCVPPIFIAYTKVEILNLPIERLFLCIWFAIASVGTAGLLLYNYIGMVAPAMQHSKWPSWMHTLGWLLATGPMVLCITLGLLHSFYRAPGRGLQRCKDVFKPLSEEISRLPSEYDEEEEDGTVACNSMSYGKGQVRRKEQPLKPKNLQVSVTAPQTNGHGVTL